MSAKPVTKQLKLNKMDCELLLQSVIQFVPIRAYSNKETLTGLKLQTQLHEMLMDFVNEEIE